MAYFLIRNSDNILINKVGESIYLRNFPQSYPQKSSVIAKSNYHDYCAAIDASKNLHVIYKSSQNSIIHLMEKDKGFMSITRLEDPENTYQISNLQMVASKRCFLFYCAKNVGENCVDLIFHDLAEENPPAPQALISVPNLNSQYLCVLRNETILLMCCIVNQGQYELNLYTYDIMTNDWKGEDPLIISEYPIVDFCFVQSSTGLFISYVIEKIGHYQLFVGHTTPNGFNTKEIIGIGQKIRSKIFIYNDIIWLNYMTSQTLYACFSTTLGESFSKPQKCTLQSNAVTNIQINSEHVDNLDGNFFYGYLDNQPHIAVLSQIDIDHILYYSGTNVELGELLHTIKSQPLVSTQEIKLQEELLQLKETQRAITEQYNKLVEFTRDVQDEGKKWKKKYYRTTRESSN